MQIHSIKKRRDRFDLKWILIDNRSLNHWINWMRVIVIAQLPASFSVSLFMNKSIQIHSLCGEWPWMSEWANSTINDSIYLDTHSHSHSFTSISSHVHSLIHSFHSPLSIFNSIHPPSHSIFEEEPCLANMRTSLLRFFVFKKHSSFLISVSLGFILDSLLL